MCCPATVVPPPVCAVVERLHHKLGTWCWSVKNATIFLFVHLVSRIPCVFSASSLQIQLNAFSLSQLLKLLSPLLKNGAFSQSVLASLGVSEILQHLTEDDRVIVKDIAAENLAHIATLPVA